MLREIRVLIRSVILEGKVEDLALKYPEIDVEELAQGDPSPTKKYLSWMVKQASLGANPNDLIPTIQYFHNNTPKFTKKDVNAYRSLRDLEDEVKAASEIVTKTQQRKEIKQGGSDTLYEDDEVIVKHIKEKDACQTYGAGTKWCITMRDHSYWEQYVGANVVFYFILRKSPNNNPLDKVAVAAQRDRNNKISKIQVFDATDEEIDEHSLQQDVLELIKQHAPTVPKGLLVKIKEGTASLKEIESALDLYWVDENTIGFIAGCLGENTPEQMWWRIVSHESPKVRAAAAKNEHVPSDVLIELARDEAIVVRQGVAQNTSTPPKTLTMLMRDKDWTIHHFVTQNLSTPPEIIAQFAKSQDREIRTLAAMNTSTHPEVLAQLARDKDWRVRGGTAQNTSTPPEALVELARDENWRVRKAIAQNTSTPPEILVELARDEDVNVKICVMQNTATPPKILTQFIMEDASEGTRWAIAHNTSTPPEVLAELARDEDWEIRREVAMNTSTHPKILAQFARDKHINVRGSVVFNTSTPLEVLVQLTKDENVLVKQSAEQNLAKRQMK